MGVPISNVTRRVVYAASGTGPYNFTFEILAATDIAVYRDDTLLTLTTNYTVTINSNGTGYVTLVAAPTGATQIAIVGNRTIQRTTDFVTGGDFFANTVNDELDQQTIFAQQNAEGLQRALQAPQTDPTTIDMTLPGRTERAGRYLSFNDDGDPIPGPIAVNIEGIADIIDEIQIVSDISTEVVNVAGQEANITTIAPISSAISTVASISSAVSSVASNMTDVQNASENADAAAASAILANDWATKTSGAVAGGEYSAKYHAQAASTSASDASTYATNAAASYDSFDDRYLGAKSSGPTLDNDGNSLLTGALYWNTGNNSLYVWTGSAWDQAAFNITGTGVSSFNTRTGGVTLSSTDVTTALGFTPGAGDVVGPSSSVDSELALFNSTTGKLIKRASLTGIVKATSGVAAAATAGTDYLAPPSGTALLKANSGGALANATAGTDYLEPPSGTALLKANSGGALANATAGTDYASPSTAQTWTLPQRGQITAANTGSFDMNVENNFTCTPTGTVTLTFTNITAGQSGFITLVNGSNYTIAKATAVKVASGLLTTLSATGTYLLSYHSPDGTNVYLTATGALS